MKYCLNLIRLSNALTKASKSHESVNDYVLIEEVQRGWDKRQSEKSTSQRFLDPHERPLEAQAHWQGEGRFILKKLSDDPSTRAWVTTIRSSSKKERKRQETELSGDELHDWGETEEMFLVCVYNVSPEQPYAILKAPITSTAQDIIAQALVKARRMEDPSSFVLVEQVEYPPLDDSSLSGPLRRQGTHKNRRVLNDNENVYKAQARWKAKGWFELKKREEALHNNKRSVGTKSGSLSRLGRLRSSSRTKDSEKSSPRHPPLTSERHIKSMNDSGNSKEDIDHKPPKRVVHSEGETISDDDECKDGVSSISKFKRISLRKLKAWR
ncbi:1-phosphatidylinositol 4,5-bisphosphate phosphodiesterase epsilon-1-like [Limulus polyphemus]|uniref:1-phosphatidylinositol 4,5-bisphosphate phosphodiesterase epsilon-1-like n=1 Tax=Limulus polyphemus TaxID=6850 RepID=A0ABM1RUH2_LIMPO|nr:1-phosphatidylinositol 4,5-bisphosphate phosphodiesterase epsilon-1-like [Limulus polyphemus]